MKIGFRSEDWIPPVMYYYSKFKYERLEEFLKLLEFKFAGDWICGITPTVSGLMSIFWTQKVKLFYAALLANNSH